MAPRTLPHSLEAEASVLGGILLRNEVMLQLAELVEDDFYDPKHQAVFAAMRVLESQAKPIDETTLGEELRKAGRLEAVGGVSFLSGLALKVPTADNVVYYADIVRDRHAARRLMVVASDITAKGYEDYGNVEDYFDEAEAKIFEVTQRRSETGPKPIKGEVRKVFVNLEERMNSPSNITGIPTGLTDLDEHTSGLQPTELIILAARPAMGKTSLALSIAQNCSRPEHGSWPVLIFSLEMSSLQLTERLLCSEAAVDSQSLRRGSLTRQDMSNLTLAASNVSSAPILIDDTPAMSLRQVRARSRQFISNKELMQERKSGLILIDYLQLMRGSPQTRQFSREQEISEISRGLKSLARELNCPVLALSQLNRSLESRPNKRPLLSDLRESGAIEQDADVILFIYRDVIYNEDTEEPDVAEVILGKNRHGDTKTTKVRFEGRFTRFSNLSYRSDDEYH